MNKISLSINPTYLCNFRCNFCYLTEKQLSDSSRLDLSKLEKKLKEIKEYGYTIDHVDLYGGEVGLLPLSYLEEMDNILENFDNPNINVVTNLYKINPYFEKEHVDLSVSYDFKAREKHDQVLQNIIKSKKRIAILMLASHELIKYDVDGIIKIFNQISNIKTVEIKPYSKNQANDLKVSDSEFEEYIKKWLTSNIPKNFNFKNEENIKLSLSKQYNAFSSDHLYITPKGNFAVLEFDSENKEFFLDLDSIEKYKSWVNLEKTRVYENIFCSKCSFLGNCLTEHYREVTSLDHSCNGYKKLLNWAKDHNF